MVYSPLFSFVLLLCVLVQLCPSGAVNFPEIDRGSNTFPDSFLNWTAIRIGKKRTIQEAKDEEDAWKRQIRKLRGSVTINYLQGNVLLPAKSIKITLTPQMIGRGSRPTFEIENFQNFKKKYGGDKNSARCHIVAARFGGSGRVSSNLFPCYQLKFNSPVMSGCENTVANQLANGNEVEYFVTTEYNGRFYPTSVTIKATLLGSRRKKLFHVRIENTPTATLTRI